MTWLREVELLGPRRFAVGRTQSDRSWEGGPAESYFAAFPGSGTQTLSSGYAPGDSPKLPRQDARELVDECCTAGSPSRSDGAGAKAAGVGRGAPRGSYPRGGRVCGVRPSQKKEGAAMLVVLLILLMSTATAVFAVHSTSTEVRAAGFWRMSLQTQYLGETGALAAMSWVDRFGAPALLSAMRRTTTSGAVLDMSPFEPALAAGKEGYRMYPDDFTGLAIAPVENEVIGPRAAHQPFFMVDVYDTHIYTGVVAGNRSDGASRLRFLGATYTSRGRVRVPGEAGTATDPRPFNEGASDARARGVSGPFGQ